MKKKLLIIFVMIGILFPSLVSAQTYFKITNNYNSDYSTGPEVRDYTSVIDGMTSMVYCLDPGLHWYGAGKDYKVLRTVNPETPGGNQKYDIALTYAYQRLLQLGYTSRNTFNRVVGTTLFRLLQMHFQPRGDVLYDGAYNYYKNNGVNLKQTEAVRSARAIYTEAIGLAYSGRSYEDLIKNGFIVDDGSGNGGLWGPQWTSETKTVEYSKEPTTGGDVINYTFSVMPVEASKTPEYYKEYTSLMKISCSNTTVKCSFDANQTPDLGPAGVLVTLVVDVSKWDRKDMGITLDLSYCDARSSYQLVILERADGSKVQQMLAPLPSSSCTATPAQLSRQNNVPHSSISIATPLTDSCLCNTSTGVYEYTDKNGNKTTCDPAKEDCTEFKNGKTCPGTCEKNKSCSKENDKYYCKNGQECNADEYQKDCEDVILEETCKKLEDACDKNPNGPECDEFNQKCLHPACTHPTNNEYYCNDGKPCSSDEYQKDCEEPKLEETCKKLEDACDKNPNGPECDEFNQKCVDCNPTVSIPSDCADITDDPDDYLSKSGLKGSISDINKDELSSCNKYANQVKACVIGKNDSTGASFEDTTDKNKGAVSSGQSENRYCSVWCEETYDFTLPSAVRTQSGGYFTLSMKINGTRNCYTSGSKDKATPINKEQFEKDLEAKQQEVIDAYNEYLFNLEGVKYYEEYLSTLNEQGDYDILKENNRINNIYYVKKSSDSSCNGRDCTNHEDGDSFPDNFPEDCDDVYIYRYQFTATQYTLRKVNGQLVLSKSSSRSFVPGTERKNEAIKDGDEDYDDSELHDSTSVYGLSNDCSCGGSCGTDGGDDATARYEQFKEDAEEAKTNIQTKIRELNQIVNEYNSCSGNISITNPSDNSVTTSAGWTNEMEWEPEIDFTYHEQYLENTEGKFNGQGEESHTTSMYCTGDTDNKYNCLSGESIVNEDDTNDVPSDVTTTIDLWICDENENDEVECYKVPYTISNAKWVRKTVNTNEEFKPQVTFSTAVQFGTIKQGKSDEYPKLYTSLPEGSFPVSMITKTGVFPFTFKFSNIGQSNQDHSNGRLIGNKLDVLTAFNNLDSSLQCTNSEYGIEGDQTATTDVGYVCHYVNNCDECKFVCEDNDCSFKGCDGTCDFSCKNCIFDGTRSNYGFRSVSVNNLNPNDRPLGYNWDSNVKASLTKREIEEAGESIYLHPQYSYTLEPVQLKHVREYNKEAKNYTNAEVPSSFQSKVTNASSVYCDELKYDNGIYYSVRCRSSFLDLIDNYKNYFAKDVYRITKDDDAWELFDEKYCPSGFGNGECMAIGPSWRIRSDS